MNFAKFLRTTFLTEHRWLLLRVEVNFTANWWSPTIISVLLNLSYSFSCCFCNLICNIVLISLSQFNLAVKSFLLYFRSVCFYHGLNAWNKMYKRNFLPFVGQLQTSDLENPFGKPSSIIDNNPIGTLDWLWHFEKISYPLLRVGYFLISFRTPR